MVFSIQPISRDEAERWANALPLNQWTIKLDPVALPLQAGLRYWQSLPAPLGCPRDTEFDTLEISQSLKDTVIAKRRPDDGVTPLFRSYFIGPRLEQRLHIRSNREQKFPHDEVSPTLLLQFREISLLLDAWRAPLIGTGTFGNFKDLNYLKFEALILPLCDATGAISRTITLLDFGPDKEL